MDDRLREARNEINDATLHSPPPAQVRAALDVIRPGLYADGGNLELLSIEEDGTVRITLQGACARCPAREMTLRRVIEPSIRERVQGVTSVILS